MESELRLFQQCNRAGRNTGTLPYDPKSLGSCSLDRYLSLVNHHNRCECFDHCGYEPADPGLLKTDRAVNICYFIALMMDEDDGSLQQYFAVYITEFFSIIGKVPADVTHGRSPQQGVTYGMYEHIPVRMAQGALVMGNDDAPEGQGDIFLEPVYIITYSDSVLHTQI